MSEFGGLCIYGNTTITSMHVVPPKTEYGCPSGEGIKNGHIRYPFYYGGTQKEKECMLIKVQMLINHDSF